MIIKWEVEQYENLILIRREKGKGKKKENL
jgi:hypothetical protein